MNTQQEYNTSRDNFEESSNIPKYSFQIYRMKPIRWQNVKQINIPSYLFSILSDILPNIFIFLYQIIPQYNVMIFMNVKNQLNFIKVI